MPAIASTTDSTITPDALDALNDVLGGVRDGATNYRTAGKDLRRRDVADALLQYAAERDGCARALEAEIRRLGHEPAEGGSLAATARRAAQEVTSAVSGHDDSYTLGQIESGLDQGEKYYQLALRQAVPSGTRAVLAQQYAALQRQHDQVIAYLRQDPGAETAHV